MTAPSAYCNPLLVTSRRSVAAVLALIVMLGAGSAAAAPAKRSGMKKATKAAQNAFEAVLDAQKPAIVGCVMMHGISQGAPSVKLDVKVLINRAGQVFNLELQVTQTGGDKNATTECVKQALTKIQFPASSSALTELRRQWMFART
jgi:hypothetical protein